MTPLTVTMAKLVWCLGNEKWVEAISPVGLVTGLFVGKSFGYSGALPVPFDVTLHGHFKKTKLNTGNGL
jgi:hypothetical protein